MIGKIVVRYRPLHSMDRLHLYVANAALEGVSVEQMSELFSLPVRVIRKELETLEAFGFGQVAGSSFELSKRAREVLSVWRLMDRSDHMEVETSSQQWVLGPGEFSAPENSHCFQSCSIKAKQLGIASAKTAGDQVRHLRRCRAELSEFFKTEARMFAKDDVQDVQQQADSILAKLDIACDNKSIERLERSFASLLDCTGIERGEQKAEYLSIFSNKAKVQRQENRKLAAKREAGVALLLSEWLGPVSYTHLTLPTTPYV